MVWVIGREIFGQNVPIQIVEWMHVMGTLKIAFLGLGGPLVEQDGLFPFADFDALVGGGRFQRCCEIVWGRMAHCPENQNASQDGDADHDNSST